MNYEIVTGAEPQQMNCEEIVNFETEKEIVKQEIEEITKEEEAFISLSKEFEDLNSSITSTQTNICMKQQQQEKPNITLIRELYSEKILQLSHLTEAYNESPQQHMVEELAKGLVIAVKESSDLYPKLKQALINSAISSAEARSSFKEKLKLEISKLNEFEDKLNKICVELDSIKDTKLEDKDFNGLRYSHARFSELLTECEELSLKRQQQIRRRNSDSHLKSNGQIETYLFSECEYSYPILGSIAEISDFIENRIQVIENLVTKL